MSPNLYFQKNYTIIIFITNLSSSVNFQTLNKDLNNLIQKINYIEKWELNFCFGKYDFILIITTENLNATSHLITNFFDTKGYDNLTYSMIFFKRYITETTKTKNKHNNFPVKSLIFLQPDDIFGVEGVIESILIELTQIKEFFEIYWTMNLFKLVILRSRYKISWSNTYL